MERARAGELALMAPTVRGLRRKRLKTIAWSRRPGPCEWSRIVLSPAA